MNDEMKVAYIRAQTIAAECEIAAMRAANADVYMKRRGRSDDEYQPAPYGYEDFAAVPEKYGITHNQVIGYFTDRS